MYVASIYDVAEILSPTNKAILGVGEGSMELAPPEAISCMDGWMFRTEEESCNHDFRNTGRREWQIWSQRH